MEKSRPLVLYTIRGSGKTGVPREVRIQLVVGGVVGVAVAVGGRGRLQPVPEVRT